MKVIKTIKKGNKELIHKRGVINFIEEDFFEIIVDTGNSPRFLNIPFMGMIKAGKGKVYSATNDYTEEEYEQMFNEQVEKYNKLYKR